VDDQQDRCRVLCPLDLDGDDVKLASSLVGPNPPPRHIAAVRGNRNALAAIAQACSIARVLQPAAVIVEDVDLIAEQRGMHPGQNPLLFQLLNEMDGLGEDVDVVFLLTTNRADLLEPALVARPGRVDQAIEIPIPDENARRELIKLYRGNLRLEVEDFGPILERTSGVTASFLKELIRRPAMEALIENPQPDGDLAVGDRHLRSALD
jgi:SpoVK/Ycf46/Vps4 family AAA+-type ATPase